MLTNITNHATFRQLTKYLAMGGLAFVVEYTLFLLLLHLLTWQHELIFAQTISFCGGLITSFLGNRHITFRHTEKDYTHSSQHQFLRYGLLAVTNLVITNILIFTLVNQAGFKPQFAKLVVMALVALWNYILFRKFIFKVS